MSLPINGAPQNSELSIDELDEIAGGGFWSRIEHFASDVGHVASKIGIGVAIGVSIFGAISLAGGGPATQRGTSLN